MGLTRIRRNGECFVVHPDLGTEVPAAEYYATLAARQHNQSARSHLAAPQLIRDDLGTQGLWHPATGTRTDSKSEFRQMTKDAGCEEVGNEQIKGYEPPPLPPVRDDLKAAMAQQGFL